MSDPTVNAVYAQGVAAVAQSMAAKDNAKSAQHPAEEVLDMLRDLTVRFGEVKLTKEGREYSLRAGNVSVHSDIFRSLIRQRIRLAVNEVTSALTGGEVSSEQ